MMEEYKKFKVAAVQASPVLPMNMKATVDKACTLIEEAGKKGAQLVVFPETFVPMYPNWSIDLQNPTEWAQNLFELTKEAIEIPGKETELIGKAAVVKVALALEGTVFFKGERWTAISETGRVEPGEEVTITKVDGLILHVTKK